MEAMRRITIIASGTRGDVQPAIALGVALRAAGYRVRLLAGSGFRGWIEGHGLEAAPSEVDMEALMASHDGRAWVERGHDPLAQLRLMRRLLDRFAGRLTLEAWEASQDADAVIGSFTSDSYALAIGEKRGVPVLSMPLQPTLIATRDGRSAVHAPRPDRVSRVNGWFGRLLIEPFPWLLYGRHVNRFRRRIGLPTVGLRRDVEARRRMTVLHAVSRHVMPRPADWPASFHVTGYWFLDDERDWEPPPALLEFLDAGPAPVCIGFGSMTGHEPSGTTQLIADAVRRSGQRAVLLAGWAGIGSAELGPDLLCLAEAPHAWLFPRMAAVIHHGGAGTTAAGLAAGVPSIVIPHFADQPYWGRRVQALGVGPRPLARHRLTSAGLAAAIRESLDDATMRRRAAELGARIRQEDGMGNAVAIVRQVAGS
jgi:UDP:flavonoid glycosyltransferase YjiC (YdhE family)